MHLLKKSLKLLLSILSASVGKSSNEAIILFISSFGLLIVDNSCISLLFSIESSVIVAARAEPVFWINSSSSWMAFRYFDFNSFILISISFIDSSTSEAFYENLSANITPDEDVPF